PDRGRGLDRRGPRLALGRRAVPSRRQNRAQHELAIETARLETAARLGHLIEGYTLGDARSDGASCPHAEEPLEGLLELGGMARRHRIDRVEAGVLAAGQ